MAIWFPFLLLAQIITLIAPGSVIAYWLYTRKHFSLPYLVPISAALGCMLSGLAFWAYLNSLFIGLLFTCLLGLASILGIIYFSVGQQRRLIWLKPDVYIPLILLFFTPLLYGAVTFGCKTAPVITDVAQYCEIYTFSFDNKMPEIVARNVFDGEPHNKIGDWQGSDRPPLQSGIILAHSPFTMPINHTFNVVYTQQLCILLQSFWVLGIWIVGRRMRLSGGQLALVLAFCFGSSFFLIHSIYVWPKLLAAGLLLIALSLMLFEKPTWTRYGLAGLTASGAYLAHSSAVFTLLPLAVLPFFPRFARYRKFALAMVGVFALWQAPWVWYQKFYDPPGDRLLKWYLAGQIELTDRSALRSIEHTYNHATLGDLITNRWKNLTTLIGTIPPNTHSYMNGWAGAWRGMEFFFVSCMLGISHSGWIAYLHKPNRYRARKSPAFARTKIVIALGVSSLLAWALILFRPGDTIVHQSSFATLILIFIGLCALLIISVPRIVTTILLSIEIAYLLFMWIFMWWREWYLFDGAAITIGIIGIAGLAWCLRTMSRTLITEEA